jgi:hypothetical protein
MARRCDYEEKEYPDSKFKLYDGGPLYEHLKAPPRHLNNGLEIGQARSQPGVDYGTGPMSDESQGQGVSYGSGPMGDARDPRDA